MAIASVVTMGYSVSGGYQAAASKLPTLGYGMGDATVPDTEGIQYAAPQHRLHTTAGVGRIHATSPSRRLHARSERN